MKFVGIFAINSYAGTR